MNSRIFILLVLLLCAVMAIAGCTGTQNTGAAPSAMAQSAQPGAPGTPAPTSATFLIPTKTDPLEPARSVNVNIEKDYLGMIHATFQGGAGLIHVRKIEVTVNRADGQVRTDSVGIKVDDSASLEGTKQTDRVMVYVTLDDGKTYKIFDDYVHYKPR